MVPLFVGDGVKNRSHRYVRFGRLGLDDKGMDSFRPVLVQEGLSCGLAKKVGRTRFCGNVQYHCQGSSLARSGLMSVILCLALLCCLWWRVWSPLLPATCHQARNMCVSVVIGSASPLVLLFVKIFQELFPYWEFFFRPNCKPCCCYNIQKFRSCHINNIAGIIVIGVPRFLPNFLYTRQFQYTLSIILQTEMLMTRILL